jgi:hypothetical protein
MSSRCGGDLLTSAEPSRRDERVDLLFDENAESVG